MGTAVTGRALNRYNAWAAIRKRAKADGASRKQGIRARLSQPFRHGTDPEVPFGQQLWLEVLFPGSTEHL
jgi:hypothetical protein